MSEDIEASHQEVSRLRETIQSLRSEANELQQRASAALRELRDRGMEYKATADDVYKTVDEYVRENPEKAALIAGAAGISMGVIIGLLMRGRR